MFSKLSPGLSVNMNAQQERIRSVAPVYSCLVGRTFQALAINVTVQCLYQKPSNFATVVHHVAKSM